MENNPNNVAPSVVAPSSENCPCGHYRCVICGKFFSTKKSLFGHMRCHPEREFERVAAAAIAVGELSVCAATIMDADNDHHNVDDNDDNYDNDNSNDDYHEVEAEDEDDSYYHKVEGMCIFCGMPLPTKFEMACDTVAAAMTRAADSVTMASATGATVNGEKETELTERDDELFFEEVYKLLRDEEEAPYRPGYHSPVNPVALCSDCQDGDIEAR